MFDFKITTWTILHISIIHFIKGNLVIASLQCQSLFLFNFKVTLFLCHGFLVRFCLGSFDIVPEDKGALIYTDVSFECEVTVALGEDEDLQFFKGKNENSI